MALIDADAGPAHAVAFGRGVLPKTDHAGAENRAVAIQDKFPAEMPISHRSWLANRGYIPHLKTAAERRFCETARIAIMAPTWIAVASFLTVAAVVMMDQLGWVDVL